MVQIDYGAIIQGLVAAGAVIMVILVYFEKVGSISNDISQMSENVSEMNDTVKKSDLQRISDDIKSVDLKNMERTINKFETFLDAQISDQFQIGGQNSVRYECDEIDLALTISYLGDPEWHDGLLDKDWPSGITVFEIKFDEEVDTKGIFGLLTTDEELEQTESELFGDEAIIDVRSPYKMVCGVNSGNYDEVAQWIEVAVSKIEESEIEIRRMSDEFDEVVSEHLSTAEP